jgi:hypothetical protein
MAAFSPMSMQAFAHNLPMELETFKAGKGGELAL